MELMMLEEMLETAGVYGGAFDKKTGKLVYLSKKLAAYFPNAKVGDDYKTAIPVHGLFGDGAKDTKGLMFDPCDGGIWFSNYTVNRTLDGREVVMVYAVPAKAPTDFMIVKTEEI